MDGKLLSPVTEQGLCRQNLQNQARFCTSRQQAIALFFGLSSDPCTPSDRRVRGDYASSTGRFQGFPGRQRPCQEGGGIGIGTHDRAVLRRDDTIAYGA
jgi:hypothetical protein